MRNIALPADYAAEHERRVAALAEKFAIVKRAEFAMGPTTRPVFCKDLARWFDSCTAVVDFINGETGARFRRNAVRDCITKGCRLGGLTFIYDGPPETRPLPRNNASRAVQCLGRYGEPFSSVKEAANFAGCTPAEMRKALDRDGAVGNRRFAYAHKPMPLVNLINQLLTA